MPNRNRNPPYRLMPLEGTATIEVVICTFNGERFIGEQLRSILAQTRPVNLISVYDDASLDATLHVVDLYTIEAAALGVQLCAMRNERNLGYIQNFSNGLARTTCDIILLCDQDDVWESNKVERLVGEMTQLGCAMVFSDGTLIDANGVRINGPTVLQSYGLNAASACQFSAAAWPRLLCRNYVNGAAMAVRRQAALSALPIPADFPHDYWLALCMAEEGGIVCLPEALYRYRQHGANTIGIGRSNLRHQLISIWRNPLTPRFMDLLRTKILLERMLAGDGQSALLEQKYAWLVGVVDESNRVRRVLNIVSSWLRGKYSQFGTPYALLRDFVGVIR